MVFPCISNESIPEMAIETIPNLRDLNLTLGSFFFFWEIFLEPEIQRPSTQSPQDASASARVDLLGLVHFLVNEEDREEWMS